MFLSNHNPLKEKKCFSLVILLEDSFLLSGWGNQYLISSSHSELSLSNSNAYDVLCGLLNEMIFFLWCNICNLVTFFSNFCFLCISQFCSLQLQANFNDKFDEHRKKWGGGIMGSKSLAKTKAKERVIAKEAAQRMSWASSSKLLDRSYSREELP